MMTRASLWLFALLALALPAAAQKAPAPRVELAEIAAGELPKEGRDTIALIRQGGPPPRLASGQLEDAGARGPS